MTSGSGTPTGNVEFFSGATSLGVRPMTSGTATLSISTLAVGTYTITARYAGEGIFASSISTNLIQNVVTPDFSIAVNPTSLTIRRGNTGTAQFTVTPTGGFTGTVTFACNSLPQNVTCTFAPPSVTPNGAPVTSTLTINTTTQKSAENVLPVRSGAGVVLAALMFGTALGFRRRVSGVLLAVMLSLGLVFGLSGCGGVSDTAAAGTYPLSVSAGVGTGSGSHSVSLTVNIVD